jgi:hypothetical protein
MKILNEILCWLILAIVAFMFVGMFESFNGASP